MVSHEQTLFAESFGLVLSFFASQAAPPTYAMIAPLCVTVAREYPLATASLRATTMVVEALELLASDCSLHWSVHSRKFIP